MQYRVQGGVRVAQECTLTVHLQSQGDWRRIILSAIAHHMIKDKHRNEMIIQPTEERKLLLGTTIIFEKVKNGDLQIDSVEKGNEMLIVAPRKFRF